VCSFIEREGTLDVFVRFDQQLQSAQTSKAFETHRAYTRANIVIGPRDNDSMSCKCGSQMVMSNNNSIVICQSCGLIRECIGTEQEQIQMQTKSSCQNKIKKRRNESLNCIFGIEDRVVPNEVIDHVQKCMLRDMISTNTITCAAIHNRYLDGYNDYKKNSIKIWFITTGVMPFTPSTFHYDRICEMYDVAIKLYKKLNKDSKRSNKYIPFLKRCIEIVYRNNPDLCATIVSRIHPPNDKTEAEYREIWKKICEASEGVLPYIY
jgi:hypothetical protein